MSGGASNDGTFLGVNFSPVNVNVPEPCRKVVRAPIPLKVPSSSGRVISHVGFLDGLCACSYDVFTSLQVLSADAGCILSGKNCLWNSPMYVWLGWHWRNFLTSGAINEGVLVACLAFVGT